VIPQALAVVLTSFALDAIQPQEKAVFTDAWSFYAALRRLGIDYRQRKAVENTSRSICCRGRIRSSET